MLLGGGMATALTVELLASADPASAGPWLTAWQVAGIAAGSVRSQMAARHERSGDTDGDTGGGGGGVGGLGWFRPRRIPLRLHAGSAALVVSSMVASNAAISHPSLPLPLHILLKSASLPASAAAAALSRRAPQGRLRRGSIVAVTAGVVLATAGGAMAGGAAKGAAKAVGGSGSGSGSGRGATAVGGGLGAGAALAAVSVVLAAALGSFQDAVYARHGRHWQEALFYSHALALPAFALWRRDLATTLRRWRSRAVLAERLVLPLGGGGGGVAVPLLPRRWLLLALNLLSAHLAMSGIYRVTTATSALGCTMAVTTRKFASLLLSLALFTRGTFGRQQWAGTALVFGGTVAYAVAPQRDRAKS